MEQALGGNKMRKILILILLVLLVAGCSETASGPVFEEIDDGLDEAIFELELLEEDLTEIPFEASQ